MPNILEDAQRLSKILSDSDIQIHRVYFETVQDSSEPI